YCDIQNVFDFQWTLCNQIPDRRAFHKRHRKENCSLAFIDFKNRADVGMIQRSHRFGLTLELLSQRVLGNQLRRDKLQRDGSLQLRVLSFVHHSHTALAELLLDVIMRDSSTDHRDLRLRLTSFDNACSKVVLKRSDALDSETRGAIQVLPLLF